MVAILQKVNWKHDVSGFGEINQGLTLLLQTCDFVPHTDLLRLALLDFERYLNSYRFEVALLLDTLDTTTAESNHIRGLFAN
jgi:hypothetical protein